jgi:hypothetical protein
MSYERLPQWSFKPRGGLSGVRTSEPDVQTSLNMNTLTRFLSVAIGAALLATPLAASASPFGFDRDHGGREQGWHERGGREEGWRGEGWRGGRWRYEWGPAFYGIAPPVIYDSPPPVVYERPIYERPVYERDVYERPIYEHRVARYVVHHRLARHVVHRAAVCVAPVHRR